MGVGCDCGGGISEEGADPLMKRWIKYLIFPLIAGLIFASLVLAYRYGTGQVRQVRLSFALGMLAYALLIIEVGIASRPRGAARTVGLPHMYAVHGVMGLLLLLAAVLHFFMMAGSGGPERQLSVTTLAGLVALILFVIVTLSGAFFLSDTFIRTSRFLLRLKDKVLKREVGLWLHRFVIGAMCAVYVHIMSMRFLSANIPFRVLVSVYAAFAAFVYIASKVRIYFYPKYNLAEVTRHNTLVWELVFRPATGRVITYRPGQYVFVRFIRSRLPRQSHPFSVAGTIREDGDALRIMVKNAGDYTGMMPLLRKGDVATLEGPYGDFFDAKTEEKRTPLVMLAGGIGITPILSIIRDQIERQPQRQIWLFWGLTYKDDLLLEAPLGAASQAHPNFRSHILFSGEQVDGFDHGQITDAYLTDKGADTLYSKADFFICGPAGMMRVMKRMLRAHAVPADRIHIEEFSL